MNNTYKFEFENMEFSKDGQLDELIALDRYAVPSYSDYKVGDTVVAIVDKEMGTKKVAIIEEFIDGKTVKIRDRFGDLYDVNIELIHKPLELKPAQLWERWAKGAASVESKEKQNQVENDFKWLLDGYRYSPGGRIQLMLGQEFVRGEKAQLTAFNCFVIPSAERKEDDKEQFLEVIDKAFIEASIMRRGGGVGTNISYIKTVKGSESTKKDFNFYLDENHKDYQELLDRMALGKFNGVTVFTSKGLFNGSSNINETHEFNVEKIVADDSVDGLFSNLKQMIKASYEGKVIYIDFNNLRERNSIVKGVNGRSSGAVSWMELFALVAELLQQNTIDNVEFAEIFSFIVHLIIQGGSRRGALMLVCEDHNENIIKFIERKKGTSYLSGANLSVGISEEFMIKVENGDNDAKKLWNLIIKSAWESAEPGVIFLERYNNLSNSWYYNPIIATNPCGEQGLPKYGVCNLGHHVLPRFYDKKKNDVNWEELKKACHIAVRFQDNIIDYTEYFLEENREVQMSERRVGIGTVGLGTLLIKLGLRYGSDEAAKFVDKLYQFIAVESYKASIDIAKEKGHFPNFVLEQFLYNEKGKCKTFAGQIYDLLDDEYKEKFHTYGIRNVTILTQAPVGSTGTMIDNIPEFRKKFGGVTTGIEPYFSWEYWRAGRLGVTKQTVDLAKEYMDKHGFTDIKDLPNYFVTAMDLSPEDHVKVQGAIQKWTDSSISKTANCPSNYTIEETDALYRLAYKLGLKGMTIYRDGSRDAQVLATKEEDAKLEFHIEAEKLKQIKEGENKNIMAETVIKTVETSNNFEIKKRPKRLYGFTEKVTFMYGDNVGKAYVTVNMQDGEPWEIFVSTKVKDVSSLAKALGLMTTKLLRLGGASDNLQQAIDTLTYDQTMGTLPYAIANILKDIQKEKIKSSGEIKLQKCPNCGAEAYDKGNCICHACGVSKCN